MPKSFFENKELREKRFETIINTSLRLFATYGYKKVTIDQITKECHYSHGLFYHYFDTKDSVLKEIENRCNKLFKDEFVKLSKEFEIGEPFLVEVVRLLINYINQGHISNYYVHLMLSTQLARLNEGDKFLFMDKETNKLLVKSLQIIKESTNQDKITTFKNTVIYFLTVIDSLSYYKIVYPNIYSNKVNADSFYTKLINFVYKNN